MGRQRQRGGFERRHGNLGQIGLIFSYGRVQFNERFEVTRHRDQLIQCRC